LRASRRVRRLGSAGGSPVGSAGDSTVTSAL
jgi:hypothetical protein